MMNDHPITNAPLIGKGWVRSHEFTPTCRHPHLDDIEDDTPLCDDCRDRVADAVGVDPAEIHNPSAH